MMSTDEEMKRNPGDAKQAQDIVFLETAPLFVALKAQTEDLVRYQGDKAELGMSAAQLRTGRDKKNGEQIAQAAARLCRQLARRNIELKDRIAYAELALRKSSDHQLSLELGQWWALAGDHAHAASLLQSVVSQLPAAQQAETWMAAGQYFAKSKRPRQAHQAFDSAARIDKNNPHAHEAMGALGFSGELPRRYAALSYLRAAVLRHEQNESGVAFENFVRSFEVDPTCDESAEALSEALRARGRSGAADEILREHARKGSASQRAGFHQRRFIIAARAGAVEEAIEAGIEANLDIEIGLEETRLALVQLQNDGRLEHPPEDFESFLAQLAVQATEEKREAYGLWLGALILGHVSEWGVDETEELLLKLGTVCPDFHRASLPTDFADESRIRSLRQQLSLQSDLDEQRTLRLRIVWGEVALGRFEDAFEVLEPLASSGEAWGNAAVLTCIVAGRVMRPVTRYRGLTALSRALPQDTGAVLAGVAAEGLLSFDLIEEAYLASESAVAQNAKAGRALASRALVALRRPALSSSQDLEESLAVLVARSDACRMLAASAEQRGSTNLALTWGERLFDLRPGDPDAGETYLRLALTAEDSERLALALRRVIAAPFELSSLEDSIAVGIRALSSLSSARALDEGEAILRSGAASSPVLRAALSDLAQQAAGPNLSASLVEAQLVNADAESRPALYLQLYEARLDALDRVSAVRALRRALSSGAEVAVIEACLDKVKEDNDADLRLAKIELYAEMARHNESLSDRGRADQFFQLGVARFDLAEDKAGAFSAFERAAEFEPEAGYVRLAHHLCALFGLKTAAETLDKWAQHVAAKVKGAEQGALDKKARLQGLAAELYLEDGQLERAFFLAQDALMVVPEFTELLTIAERASTLSHPEALENLYQFLAEATLGVNGEKALHYRAARYWEIQGAFDLAVQHAVAAFELLPSEGVAYLLMVRLSKKADAVEVVEAALRRVADSGKDGSSKERWLELAAGFSNGSFAAGLEDLDLMTRALLSRPDVATATEVSSSFVRTLSACNGDDSLKKSLYRRLEQCIRASEPHLVGSEGASVRLVLALIALREFGAVNIAMSLIDQASKIDRELPEFKELIGYASVLCEQKEDLTQLVSNMMPYALDLNLNFGGELAQFLSTASLSMEDFSTAALFGVRAAQESPEDELSIKTARSCALKANREDLVRVLDDLLPEKKKADLALESISERSEAESLAALSLLQVDSLELNQAILVLAHLGALQEKNEQKTAAGQTWRQLLKLAPQHQEALVGVELEAERLGKYEDLVLLLERRIARANEPEMSRELKLRRCEILETQLGRVEDARDALEAILSAHGQDIPTLRMLAESWSRSNESGRAAHYWGTICSLSQDPSERMAAGLQAAEHHVLGEEWAQAKVVIAELEEVSLHSLELEFKIAQGLNDSELECRVLIDLAERGGSESKDPGQCYFQVAQALQQRREFLKAREQVAFALELLPERPDVCLLAAEITAEVEPLRSESAARAQLILLHKAKGLIQTRDKAVRAVLLADALVLTEGNEAAKEALNSALDESKRAPVVLVALASLASTKPLEALSLYEEAIGGEYHGIFDPGIVLLRAAALAEQHQMIDHARRFYSAVSNTDPQYEEASQALNRLTQLRAAQVSKSLVPPGLTPDEVRALQKEQSVLAELKQAEAQSASIRAATEKSAAELAEKEFAKARDIARYESDSEQLALEAQRLARQAAEEAERLAEEAAAKQRAAQEAEAIVRAAEDSLRMEQKHMDSLAVAAANISARAMSDAVEANIPSLSSEQMQGGGEMSSDRRETPRVPLSEAAAAALSGLSQAGDADSSTDTERVSPVEHRSEVSQPAKTTLRPRLELAMESEWPNHVPAEHWKTCISNRSEGQLVEALEAGEHDAGRELLDRLLVERGRGREAGIVAQHLARALPGDIGVLGRMITLAGREGNQPLNKAIRHVLGCYGAGEVVNAPPLQELDTQAEHAQAVLWQGLRSPSSEVMQLVWRGAHSLFSKSLSDYELSGVERVALSAHTPLGQLYRGAASLLGMGKVGLFVKREANAINMKVGLLPEPVIIVSGTTETVNPEVMFHFGAMLAAAAPEHALIYGAAPSEVKQILQAVRLGFGPAARQDSDPEREVRQLAATLWDLMSGRSQRALKELCAKPKFITLRAVTEKSRLVLRRAGLLVCGDLRVAVADAARESRLAPPTSMAELGACAQASPLIADLLAVALSQEYAEVRYRLLPQRRSVT